MDKQLKYHWTNKTTQNCNNCQSSTLALAYLLSTIVYRRFAPRRWNSSFSFWILVASAFSRFTFSPPLPSSFGVARPLPSSVAQYALVAGASWRPLLVQFFVSFAAPSAMELARGCSWQPRQKQVRGPMPILPYVVPLELTRYQEMATCLHLWFQPAMQTRSTGFPLW